MTYKEAVDYLFSLQFFGIKLGLENIRALCRELGDPFNAYETVHVAGTNGKGATCAMLASMLREAGYRTGLYTSPHLVDFRERIQVDGHPVDEDFVVQFTGRIRPSLDRLKATFFEATTAMAFTFFREAGVEVAVIETGMGGRLDATNVLGPALTVITPIGIDHVQYLGNTISEIAREKAGILKPHVPVVVAPMDAVARSILESEAERLQCPFLRAEQSVVLTDVRQTGTGHCFGAYCGCAKTDFEIPLRGKHELQNATSALAAAGALRNSGWALEQPAMQQGLRKVRWPGRFEVLPWKPPLVLDVSHNVPGAQTVVDTFGSFFPGKRALFVIGMMKDKDYAGFLRTVQPIASRFVLTQPQVDRAAEAGALAKALTGDNGECVPNVSEAVDRALGMADSDEVVVITGSFYTLGEAMQHLGIEPFGDNG
jgi:dihydrofolate synthase/folylpolyglutamate synthase